MEHKNIIFNGVFGSHLYGLSTPSSDLDCKGVYIPSMRDLVFNTYKDSIENQTAELDTTFYAITKFIKILGECDTVSFDMIHTPKQFTISGSPLWEELKTYRSDLYCKNMRGVLRYVRTQAMKYTNKVDRFVEMKELLNLIEGTDLGTKLENTTLPEIVQRSGFKFIKFIPKNKDITGSVDVCGSRYQLTAQVSYLRDGLKAKLARYGKRTLKGSVSGGDFKSLSHAYRVLVQLDELIETRDLVFPLIRAPEILRIKLGEVTQESVMTMTSNLYDSVTEKLENSDLPQESNTENIVNCVLNHILE